MSAPESVDGLLSEWQRHSQAGQHIAPEDLCRDCPELLDDLRHAIAMVQRIEGLVHHMHGGGTDEPTHRGVQRTSPGFSPPSSAGASASGGALPELPGYALLRRIGKGGMGVVYEARDLHLDRLVAIKMLHDGERDPAQRDRLLSEARAAASLNHPNIVQLFAAGEHQGRPYLVMELVSGPTLYRATGPYTPEDAARLVQLLAQAVQAAHDRRIVHRDLKPANVLLAPPAAEAALNCAWGCPKVADFGLARWLDVEQGMTRTGEATGTPSYMAPEQARGHLHDIGPATDVYGLGAILYELLARQPPFMGNTFAAVLEPLLRDDPIAPRRLRPDLPADLETICLKCLRKEPGRRYPSAQALADDLGRFLRGAPIQARPVGRLEQVWKWARREPLVVGLGAVIVVALLLAVVLLAYGWNQSERIRDLEAQRAADLERRRVEEQQNYLFQVQIADRDLRDGWPASAARTLDGCPAALRQWEWHYLHARCRQPQVPALQHGKGAVLAVAAATSGTRFASAGSDGAVCVWEPGQETPVQRLAGHKRTVYALAWSPNGAQLISGGADTRVIVWDTASWEHRSFTDHDDAVLSLAVHPSAPWVASSTLDGEHKGEILLWDRQTLKALRKFEGHRGRVTALAFSPDGTYLASASHDQTVIVWDVRSGTRMHTFTEHTFPVSCVAFSPDGRRVASAAGPIAVPGAPRDEPGDNQILVWSAGTGMVERQLRGDFSRTVALAFAPRGARLATGGWSNRVKIWDPETGQEILRLPEHGDAIMSLAFGGDGTLISGSLDGTVRMWQAPR